MRRFSPTCATRSLPWLGLLGFAITAFCPVFAAEPVINAEHLYQTRCASCHGERGEGSDEFEDPLEGNLSVAQLARLIGRTMPANNPKSLSEDEYNAIAAYIHDATEWTRGSASGYDRGR